MANLKSHYNPETGLIIPVGIAPASQPSSQPAVKICLAFLDTGANISGISSRLANELNLEYTQVTTIAAAAGLASVREYQFNLFLPADGTTLGPNSLAGWEFIKKVDGAEFAGITVHGVRMEAIVGLDVISQGTLKMTPDRHFEFSINPL